MKVKIQGLRTTIYRVGDIDAAKAWYSDVFDAKPYFDEPFYVGFNIAGYELGLQPEKEPTTDKKASVLTYWGVEDVEAAFKQFIELGATADEEPRNVGGDIVVATVKDLWGNLVGLIYNPEFSLPA